MELCYQISKSISKSKIEKLNENNKLFIHKILNTKYKNNNWINNIYQYLDNVFNKNIIKIISIDKTAIVRKNVINTLKLLHSF